MRFAIVILACALAVANAQLNRFGFQNNQYQANKYPGQYQQGQYQQGQYNRYQPFNKFQQNNKGYQPYTPFASTTYKPAPAKAFAFVSSAPAVTVAPVVPVAPVQRVAPVPVPSLKVVSDSRSAETIKSGYDISPDGSYNYFYETNNGIAAQAQGTPRNFGGNPPLVPDVAQGSFSWTSPEGKNILVTYIADENGYQPQSDALPVPPAIPAQIARALKYTAKYHKN